MLYDGIQLLGSSAASNFTIESGSTLPVSGNNLGELFYKLNDGLYVYNGSAWEAVASNATISIGGSNTQVQFNDSGSLAGSSLFTFDSGTGTLSSTLFSGSGASLTNLNGSNISSGTVGTARLGSGTASSSTFLRGDGTWATPTATVTSVSGTGYFGTYNATTGTYVGAHNTLNQPWLIQTNMNAGTNAKIYLTYVDSSGSLKIDLINDAGSSQSNFFKVDRSGTTTTNITLAATAITLTGAVTGTSFSGSGASLTNLNASNLASGTVGTARLGSGTANSTTYLRGDGTWATVSGASTSANNTWTAAQRGAVSALTYGATVTPNFDASNNFSLTATGNFTLANPTGTITPGQSGVIVITQDATGGRTISWGTYFKGAGGTKPTLSTAPGAVDVISYYVVSATQIFVTASLAIA